MADSIGNSSSTPDFASLAQQAIWQSPTQGAQGPDQPGMQQLVDQLISMPTQVAPLPPMIQPQIQAMPQRFPSGMVSRGGGGGSGSVGGGNWKGGGNEAQLRDAAYKAGFRGTALETAVAVGMAESGGNSRSLNNNPGTGDLSYGDWQINMLGGMGPERRQQYGLSSNDALFDPNTNARVAFQMSGGGKNWSPWSTYKSGAFRQFLDPSLANYQGG